MEMLCIIKVTKSLYYATWLLSKFLSYEVLLFPHNGIFQYFGNHSAFFFSLFLIFVYVHIDRMSNKKKHAFNLPVNSSDDHSGWGWSS